jgi:hypothetical protein
MPYRFGHLIPPSANDSREPANLTVPFWPSFGDVDGQAFARELVDDGQALQPLPVHAGIEYEVVRPDVIGPRTTTAGAHQGVSQLEQPLLA